jgi:26S proteasome regulatory subunit N1
MIFDIEIYEKRNICIRFSLSSFHNFKNHIMIYFSRHLSAEIASEWESTESNAELRQRLLSLTNDIIPFLMRHNAEADACDLLMEIEQLDLIETFVDKDTFSRVCLYLTR